MKFIPVLFLFLFSCHPESEIDSRLIPTTQESFVKIIPSQGEIYLQFEGSIDIALIETDRILNEGESIQIDFCNSYSIANQQTWIFEFNQRYCWIRTKINSPIYIAFR